MVVNDNLSHDSIGFVSSSLIYNIDAIFIEQMTTRLSL